MSEKSRLSVADVGDLFNRIKHGDKEHQDWLYAALSAWAVGQPVPSYIPYPVKAIPLILTCPMCNARHIDEGPFATKLHHTHSCQSCGLTWRPAIEPTVGVRFLPGFKNE